LDRVSVSEAEGSGFESRRAHHIIKAYSLTTVSLFSYISRMGKF